MSDPTQPVPKKRFTKFKLGLYLLALVGLGWLGIQAYWGFFKLRIWLAGFGTGAFWILGLIAGFIYFHSAHRIYERIKDMPQGAKKAGAYTGFSLALLVVNPLPWSLALWIFCPPGGLKTVGHWFFIGCAVASLIVLALERMFAKKKPKPEPKP
jgi:hypothetical protein